MGFVLREHGGSGDHGCEDFVRGLCKLIPGKPDVYSQHPEEDWRYGIGKLGGLFETEVMEERLEPGDWCIGDRPMELRFLHRRQARPVLWGWAPGTLTAAVLRRLRHYEAVVVTEQRSYRRLARAGLKGNLYLGPDPAFLVKPVPRTMANPIPPDTLGLCLSYPGEAGTLIYESYCRLICWVLKETSWHIALIPYCVQPRRNDLLLHRALYRKFCGSGRILFREDGDSPTLRGDLSKCRCCVGFSGAVAAWSCGVPALCLDGTARTMGLSRDLFASSYEAVQPWQQLKTEDDLTSRFRQFLNREDRHRDLLGRVEHCCQI